MMNQGIDEKEMYKNIDNFNRAVDDISIKTKLISDLVNTSDASQDVAVDQMMNMLKQERDLDIG